MFITISLLLAAACLLPRGGQADRQPEDAAVRRALRDPLVPLPASQRTRIMIR